MNKFPPSLGKFCWAISSFYEKSWRYSQLCVYDNGDKLFAGVNDTGDILSPELLPAIYYRLFPDFHRFLDTHDYLIAGVIDTSDQPLL